MVMTSLRTSTTPQGALRPPRVVRALYVAAGPLHANDLRGFCSGLGVDLHWTASLDDARLAHGRSLPDLVVLADERREADLAPAVQRLRAAFPGAMLVVETWRLTAASQVRLLDAGVDFVLPAPCPVDLFMACARAAARRGFTPPARAGDAQRPDAPDPRMVGTVIDVAARALLRGDVRTPLTTRECALLQALDAARGAVVSREALSQAVWREPYHPASRRLDMLVTVLRRKLEPDPARPRHLVTVPGAGYALFDAEPAGRHRVVLGVRSAR